MHQLTHLKSVVPISLPKTQKKIHLLIFSDIKAILLHYMFKHLHQILIFSDQFVLGINYNIKSFVLIQQRIISSYLYRVVIHYQAFTEY